MQTAQAPQAAEAAPEIQDGLPRMSASLEEMAGLTAKLRRFIKEQMVEGEDYGMIPGKDKMTLFKPGAEKLNTAFALAPMVTVTDRIQDWEHGFVAYEIKVTLINKRTGAIESEGVGNCNSHESRYKTQPAANIANTVLKMARKRALVDATLSATRTSGMFTQDIEDGNIAAHDAPRQRDSAPRQRPAQSGPRQQSGGPKPISDAQKRCIAVRAKEKFGENFADEVARLAGKDVEALTSHEASNLIDEIGALPDGVVK